MGFPWAAVAQAAGQIGGQIWESSRLRNAQRREFRHNRQMAEYAYGKDLEMWNRQSAWNREMWELQNAYNLPSAQMQRLRDAGLNPNLVAGGGSSGGQATSIQSAQSPRYQQVRANYDTRPINMPDMIGLYNAIRQSDAQVDNVRAATDLTRQKTLTEEVSRSLATANVVGKGYENQMARELAQYSGTFARFSYMKRANELKQQLAQIGLTQQQRDLTRTNKDYRKKELRLFEDYGMRSGDRFEYRILLNLLEKMMGGKLPW